MITGVIIDDEKNSSDVLKRLILETGLDVEIIGEANSVETGFIEINEKNPQLVFLDIEMLDGTGFDLLEKFDKIDFEIIFCTAYDKYAIKAFKYSALDYLLKPIDLLELESAINKVAERIGKEKKETSNIKMLLENFARDANSKKIALKGATKIDFVFINEIACLFAQGAYTEVINLGGEMIVSTNPLKYFDSMFEDNTNFFRISKSCLINLNQIKTYRKNSDMIELENGLEVEVARRRRKEFLDRLDLM